MRIIPKASKVRMTFYKGITIPDIVIGIVALADCSALSHVGEREAIRPYRISLPISLLQEKILGQEKRRWEYPIHPPL